MASSLAPYAAPATGAFGALALAANRRVDLVYLSDSNGQYNNWGWASGFLCALGYKYGQYATPLHPQNGAGSTAMGAGAPTSSANVGANGAQTGAPTAQAPYGLPYIGYNYQASGAIQGSNNGATVHLNPTDAYGNTFNAFNIASTLKGWYAYGTFASGGGTFVPGIRQENSPYSTLATGSSINCQTGTDGQAITSLTLSAGTRTTDICFKWQLPGGTASTAKTTQFWQRVEDTAAASGISVTQLYSAGGQDLYDYQTTFAGYTQSQWTAFFTAVTYSQAQYGQDPCVVILINSGDNDINDVRTPTLGPLAANNLVCNAAQGYLDNLRACYITLTAAWAASGLPTSSANGGGLYFLIMPSQVYGPTTDSATLVLMRAAAKTFAQGKPNVSFVDLAALVPQAELLANGGYSSQPHLANTTYQYIATKVVNTFVH